MSDEHFKITVGAVRKNLGLNQPEFAEKLGVSLATVVNWETGKSEPSSSKLRAMSEMSGIPMDYITWPKES